MTLWPVGRPLFGDELVLRSIDWLENFPWRNESAVRAENDKYEIRLNLNNFAPEEISVKTIVGFIVVEGKQEEKRDQHGFISRNFVRKYSIPKDCNPENVTSKVTSEGILIITVPKQQKPKGDTVIPVDHEKSGFRSKL